MQLRQLFPDSTQEQVTGSLDLEVVGLTDDPSRVRPGLLFAALRAGSTEAEEALASALARGATAVLSASPALSLPGVTWIQVPDVRSALAQAASRWYGNPSERLRVIGVAGTETRTAVAVLLRQLLEGAGTPTGLLSCVRQEFGGRTVPTWATARAPEPVELQERLSQMVQAGCKACVWEIEGPEIPPGTWPAVHLDALICTNLVRTEPGDRVSSAAYFENRRQWFEWLGQAHPLGGRICNVDDAVLGRSRAESETVLLVTHGMGEAHRLRAQVLERDRRGARLRVELPAARFDCRLPLLGRWQLDAWLAAVGATYALGLREEAQVAAIERVLFFVPGELELVPLEGAFTVVVDGACTSQRLRRTLRELRSLRPARLIAVSGSPGGVGLEERLILGRAMAEEADCVVLTSDNPGEESPRLIARQIEYGFRRAGGKHAEVVLNRRQAIHHALALARSEDVVVITGEGRKTWEGEEGAVVPFHDRVYVRRHAETKPEPDEIRRFPPGARRGEGGTIADRETRARSIAGVEE